MKARGMAVMLLFFMALPSCRGAGPARGGLNPPGAEGETGPAYRKISAEEACQMMRGTEEYILLDVRTEAEFRERRIEGAILIPDSEIGARAEGELPDRSALILVYCRSGRRSANAANELVGKGYARVYDFGGIQDWPYATVGD